MIFPRRCCVCDEIVPFGEGGIHNECRDIFRMIAPNRCIKCGKHVEGDNAMCRDCSRRVLYFEKGFSLYEYRSIEDSVIAFKNHGRVEYADYYTDKLCEHFKEELLALDNPVFIPIPIHRDKYRKRGYNQSEVLSRLLSEKTGIPYTSDILTKTMNTKGQKELDDVQRQNNIKKAFHVAQNDVKLKTIILVDDVYTTGATINAAASVMKEKGVREVYFVTLAIGEGIT